jgi:hypothetical protein
MSTAHVLALQQTSVEIGPIGVRPVSKPQYGRTLIASLTEDEKKLEDKHQAQIEYAYSHDALKDTDMKLKAIDLKITEDRLYELKYLLNDNITINLEETKADEPVKYNLT